MSYGIVYEIGHLNVASIRSFGTDDLMVRSRMVGRGSPPTSEEVAVEAEMEEEEKGW